MIRFPIHKGQKVHQMRIDDPVVKEVKVFSGYTMKTSMSFEKEDIVIDPIGKLGYINSTGWSENSKEIHPCVQDDDDVLMKAGFIGFAAEFQSGGQTVNAIVIVHMSDFLEVAEVDPSHSSEFIEAANDLKFSFEEIITFSDWEVEMVWKHAFVLRERRQEEAAFS